MNRRRVGAASVDGVAEDRRPRFLVLSVNLSRQSSCFQYFYVGQTVREGQGGGVCNRVTHCGSGFPGRIRPFEAGLVLSVYLSRGLDGAVSRDRPSSWAAATSTRSSVAV